MNVGGGPRQFAVSADGQRFLLIDRPSRDAGSDLTVVLNWTAALKQ
jgi:hypothetical protein